MKKQPLFLEKKEIISLVKKGRNKREIAKKLKTSQRVVHSNLKKFIDFNSSVNRQRSGRTKIISITKAKREKSHFG